MKAKTIIFALSLLLSIFLTPQKTHAQEASAGSSATLHTLLAAQAQDNRVQILQDYLASKNSPLAAHAATFVQQADLYHLDWRFVAAIAGRESSFGLNEPCINAWGYGIYGDQTMCFSSYDEGIRVISQALRQKYMNQWGAQTIWQIGKLYASSPTWADGVIYFMNDMQNFAMTQENQTQPLPISL